jgi:hypothetical protein
MTTDKERRLSAILNALGALDSESDPSTRTGELLRNLGVWEVAHRLRMLTTEHLSEATVFLEYLAQEYPAAADRIQILLTATKGEDKELLKREFGGD